VHALRSQGLDGRAKAGDQRCLSAHVCIYLTGPTFGSGDDGWVRKEEGRGKRGGGLARKDAALMVKQGKKLGFDSKEMSKWKVIS